MTIPVRTLNPNSNSDSNSNSHPRWFKSWSQIQNSDCRIADSEPNSNARCKFKFKFKFKFCPALVIGTCWRGFEMTVSGYDSSTSLKTQNRLEWELEGISVAAGWLYESTENHISNAQPQVSLSASYSFLNLNMLLDWFIHQLQLTLSIIDARSQECCFVVAALSVLNVCSCWERIIWWTHYLKQYAIMLRTWQEGDHACRVQ